MKTSSPHTPFIISCLLLMVVVLNLQAASGVWTNDASGNWGDAANWLNGVVADGSGSTADFSTINITVDRTVTLDAAHTISALNFGDLVSDHSWTLSGGNTLTLGASPLINVFNPAVSISSVIAGTAGLTKAGSGALTLGGATDTYTGGTTINGGKLTLDFNAAGSPTVDLIPSQNITLGGGTLNLNGTSGGTLSQAFGSLTLNAGSGAITLTPNGAASLTATLGTMNRPSVGTVVFNGPATIGANNVAVAATGTITSTSAGEGGSAGLGILVAGGSVRLAWGTVGLYDWASTYTTSGTAGTSPYPIIGGSQVLGFYTVATNNVTAPGNKNLDLVQQQVPGTTTEEPAGFGNSYSLRYNSSHAPYGHTGSGNIQVGGILVTPNLGTINAAIDAIRLTQISQLVQNNTAAPFIIGKFVSSANPFIKSGEGTLFINPIAGNDLAMNYDDASSTHTVVNYTGYNYTAMTASGNAPNPPYLNGGVTVINSTVAFACPTSQGATAGAAGTLNLNGGTLLGDLGDVTLNNPSAGNVPRNVFLGGNGGGLASDAGHTLTVSGVISNFNATIPGALTIGIPATAANGNVAGLVPGTGGSSDNTAIYGTGTVDVSGGNNAYSGGTVLQSGTVKINGINNLGGVNYGGLTFNGGTLQYGASATGYGSLDLSVGQGITLLASGGAVDLNGNTMTYANSIGNGGSGVLTVVDTVGGGVLNLSGANTYTGGTMISNAVLDVNNTSGSGTGTGNVTVNNGGVLGGSGTISGNVTVNSGGKTFPGSSGATNTIGGNLTYNTGSVANFTLTSSGTGSGNGQIVLTGADTVLTCGSSFQVGINCGAALDTTHDYLLFNLTGGGSISGSFNATPLWLASTPAGDANYVVMVTNSTQVVLHYASSSTPPVVTAATATPNPVLNYQNMTICASVTPGTGTIDPNNGVKVDLSPIGGSSTQPLIADGGGNYTNSIVLGGSVLPGSYSLTISVVDSLSGAGGANISLTVGNTHTWNGGDVANSSDWSDGTNWVSTLPPGSALDLFFDGSAGLSPVMDSSYNEASVTFNSGASAFNLTNSGGSVLTLTAGVTNNSSETQTLSLPVALDGDVTLNAQSADLALNGVLSGGALTVAGGNSSMLSAINTYTGNTTVNAGSTLVVSGGGELGGGSYAGNINNNGTFVFNSTNAQVLSGVISGGGTLAQLGTNTLALTGVNTYTGQTIITNGTLIVSGSGSLGSGNYAGNILNNGAFTYQSSVAQTMSGIISGTGSNVLNSAVTLSLNGANTYSGGTFVNEGTLYMNNLGCLGSGTVVLGAYGYSGTVSLENSQSGTYTNALIVNPGGVRQYYTAGGPSGTWSGLITLVDGATFKFGPNGNSAQTISGGTTGNGTLEITYPVNNRNAVITVTGGAVNHVGVLENTMGGTSGTAEIDAVVGPNVTNVLQNSACPMILTATNTYTGPTTISQGTLYLTGSASISNSAAISVASGATFDVSGLTGGFSIAPGQTLNGSGSINGAVTVGGTLAPTNSAAGISTLTFTNDLTLAGTSVFTLNRTNTETASKAVGLGAVTFGGTLILANTGTALQNGDSFTLFTAASGFSDSFVGVMPVSPNTNLAWDTNQLAGSGVLDVYAFTTTPLTLSTPVNTPATIDALKLANHVSSALLSAAYPAAGWTATAMTTTSQGGSAVIKGDGSLTYTPPSSTYTGGDSFTVTFQDGHGSQTMAVSVTVGNVSNGESPNLLSVGTTNIDSANYFYANFAGIPDTTYTVETNSVVDTPGWAKMTNITATATGAIQLLYPESSGSLYFRTVYPSY